MNELIGKITNLSYEFFGIIMPGAIFNLFFLIWLSTLGTFPQKISDTIPSISIYQIFTGITTIFADKGIGFLVPLIVAWYILGYIAQWFSRTKPQKGGMRNCLPRTAQYLFLKIPEKQLSYDTALENIFQEASKTISSSGTALTWREFYPIAKNIVIRNSTHSLISTYQNKYTLHRSIAMTSAILFWLNIFGILTHIFFTFFVQEPIGQNWVLQISVAALSAFLVWGFSNGFEQNWKMFGNTVITEFYSLYKAPKPNESASK